MRLSEVPVEIGLKWTLQFNSHKKAIPIQFYSLSDLNC